MSWHCVGVILNWFLIILGSCEVFLLFDGNGIFLYLPFFSLTNLSYCSLMYAVYFTKDSSLGDQENPAGTLN